jgi:hypothetical protein
LQGALNPTSLKGRRATNLLPSASCLLPSKASALVNNRIEQITAAGSQGKSDRCTNNNIRWLAEFS